MTKCIECGKEIKLPEELITIEGKLSAGDKTYIENANICLFCFLNIIEEIKQNALELCSSKISQLETEKLELSQKYKELSGDKHNSTINIPEFLQK